MNLSEIFKQAILEAKKEKPSAGLTKKQKSDVVKKAKKGGDVGKKGKGFEKIAAKAAKQYGSEEKGKKVAAAAMWKNIKRVKEDKGSINEETDLLLALAQATAAASVSAWGGFSWAKSMMAMPEFKDEWKSAASKEDKIKVLKKYLGYVFDPTNLGSYTQKDKLKENEDHEVSMAKNSLESIMKSVADLMQKLGNKERNIPGWIQDHISNAENFIDQAAQGFHELEYHGKEDEDDEDEEEGNPMIQPVDEKKLTKAEKAKKDEIINAIAKEKGGKKNLNGKDYAIATKQSIQSAE